MFVYRVVFFPQLLTQAVCGALALHYQLSRAAELGDCAVTLKSVPTNAAAVGDSSKRGFRVDPKITRRCEIIAERFEDE